MNFAMVLNQFGLLVMLLSGIMLLTPGIATLFRHGEASAIGAMAGTGLAGLLLGSVSFLLTRKRSKFLGRKEALLLVALSWIGGALAAALPFWIWARYNGLAEHPFHNIFACYFESMSGLTTTGATILGEIQSLPPSLLLWRSLMHWLGGLGIVVLFVAVLPGLGVGGKRLFQIEATGPAKEGLQPQIRETARWLWYFYVGLTVAELLLLHFVAGLGWFDSINHTFATLSTGGFSTMNASLGEFHAEHPLVYPIVITFMILAGVNFGLYYKIRRGKLSHLWTDIELRVYLGTMVAAALAIAVTLWLAQSPIELTNGQEVEHTWFEYTRQAIFTTVAQHTGTGFCTVNYDIWPFFAKALLVAMMFLGGCSGSTAGGMKVIRVWITVKLLIAEIEHIFRPQVIRPVRLGKATLDPELRLGTVVYVVGVLLLFAFGSFCIMLFESFNDRQAVDTVTSITASLATLFNVGPGLGLIGPDGNYGNFSSPSLFMMSILMALGRLEVYAIIVLFSSAFWRRD